MLEKAMRLRVSIEKHYERGGEAGRPKNLK